MTLTIRFPGPSIFAGPRVGALVDRRVRGPHYVDALSRPDHVPCWARMWDVISGAAEQRNITLLGCLPEGWTRTIAAPVKSPTSRLWG